MPDAAAILHPTSDGPTARPPRRSRYLLLATPVLAAALCPPPARANHPDPLPDAVVRQNWVLRYTDDSPYNCALITPPSSPIPSFQDRNFLPRAQASMLLRALAGPWGSPVVGDPDSMPQGLGASGFQLPDESDLDISSYDCAPNGTHAGDDCDNGSANRSEGTIRIPSTNYCNAAPENLLQVMGHEYFHHVQYGYLGLSSTLTWGKAVVEGSARMMEDQVFSQLDDAAGFSGFIGQVNQYLQVQALAPLWWQGYDAALAWKYSAERFGTLTTEPGYGSDFVRRFFENVAMASSLPSSDNPLFSAPHMFEFTMRETAPTMTLERWFHDFTLANLGRDFDTTLLPDGEIYRYVDENDGTGAAFGRASLTGFHLLSTGAPLGENGLQMPPWTARYAKALIVDCQIGDIAGFRGNVGGTGLGVMNGAQLRFGVFSVDGALATRLVRGGGAEFGAAFALRHDSGGSDPDLDVLGTVVTTTSGRRSLDYVFECGPGTLDIGFPTEDYPAYVGEPDDLEPAPLKIAIRVTGPPSLTTTNVKGLQASDFSVYVGANGLAADRAPIVGELEEAGSSYFITAVPPTGKSNEGPYDLWVNFGPSLVATEADAVLYRERDVDEVVAIDVSGSMIFPGTAGGLQKIESAKNAAKALIDRATTPGQIGAVVFDENAQALAPALSQATDAHKAALKTTVDAVTATPFLGTSIGDGLDRARVEIVTHDGPGANWALLVSDGEETAPQFWATVAPSIKAAKVHVAAFPVGEDADHRLLEEIAVFTEGFFWPLDPASSSAAAAGSAQTMASSSALDPLPNGLADAFLLADEHARGAVRLWEVEASLSAPGSASHAVAVVEQGIEDARFSFHWNDPADSLTVTITRPDLSVVTDGVAGARVYSDDTHLVFQVGNLMAGTWTVDVTASAGDVDYLGVLAGDDRRAASLDVRFGGTHDDAAHAAAGVRYLWGLPQPIVAVMKDRLGAIDGADVDAFVTHPDGSVLVLPLFDDGLHGDGGEADGVYANTYTRTTSAAAVGGVGSQGSYRVTVLGAGTNNQNEPIARVKKAAFVVAELGDPPPDSDGDTMPDRYEALHACLDAGVHDGGTDLDLDGVTAVKEWQEGTIPCHPDTDEGGETDGSELDRGANPFDPRDDALPAPIDPEVVDWRFEHMPFEPGIALEPATNLIRYPVHRTYQKMRIWRAASEVGPWAIVATLSGAALTGLYQDQGLTNDTTYYYMVQPVGSAETLGAPSLVFSGTPRAEPVPPIGSVEIAKGHPYTSSTTAELTLTASLDVVDAKISNQPDLSQVVWAPYQFQTPWILEPDPASGIATVYVQYRDAAGNVSPSIYSDSIRVVPAGSLGSMSGVVSVGGQTVTGDVSITLLGGPDLPPGFVDGAGSFLLTGLPAGVYTVVISYQGYQDAVIADVVVSGGLNTNLGTIDLAPLPAVPLPVWAALLAVLGLATIGFARVRGLERRSRHRSV